MATRTPKPLTTSPPRAQTIKPPPEPKSLSAFAQKYGRITDDPDIKTLMKYLYSRGKSGYTPIDPIFIINADHKEEWHIKEIEHHQRILFWGFTALDLFQLGVYSHLDQEDIELTNPIHPILERSMWESTQFPDRYGRKPTDIVCNGPAFSHLPRRFKGTWLADNPLVWPVLEPILRLATRMIMTFHTTSFVDALLCGERRPIPAHLDTRPEDVKQAQGPLQSFHRRSPDKTGGEDTRQAFAYFLTLFRQKGQFGISDGRTDPGDRSTPHPTYWAVTLPDYDGPGPKAPCPRVTIQLATQLLMPLLRNDCPAGERMALRYAAAMNIMHELMHAMHCLLIGDPQFPYFVRTEPYFEDHIFAELGYAYTVDTVGGVINHLRKHNTDEPHNSSPGYVINAFPTTESGWRQSTATNQRTMWAFSDLGGHNSLSPIYIYEPIHSSWYPLLHSEEFWTVGLQKFGTDMLNARTAGTTRTLMNTFVNGQGEFYRNKNLVVDWKKRSFVPKAWRGRIPETADLWTLSRQELLAVEFSNNAAVEEAEAEQVEAGFQKRKAVAGEIKALLNQVRLKQGLSDTGSLQDPDRVLGDLYKELCRRIKVEAVALHEELTFILFGGEKEKWRTAIGAWYGEFIVRLNRRLRQVLAEIMEWAVDRRGGKVELVEDIFAAASFIGGLLCTQRDILTKSNIDYTQYSQAKKEMEEELQKFLQTMDGPRNSGTSKTVTWDELYTAFDKEMEKKAKEEFMETARKATYSPESLIGATPSADLDDLFKSTGFELCCQIDEATQTSHGLNAIVGQMLLYRAREFEHSRELRQLRNEMVQVRKNLNLPPFSFKRFGSGAWGEAVDELVKRGINMVTGRGPVTEAEKELQLDCEKWTDILDVMVHNSMNPGQKRDVKKTLTAADGDGYAKHPDQGRNKRLRDNMIF